MELIFVYNADSGIANTIKDIGTKLFAPQNYDCLLCSLTHGTFRENPQWKSFRNNSSIDMLFYHRDEFEERFGTHFDYPVILKKNGPLEVVVSKEQMAEFESLNDLITAINAMETEAN